MNELVQKAEELAAAFGVGLKDLGEYLESHLLNRPLPSHTAPLMPVAPVTVVVGNGLATAPVSNIVGTASTASSTATSEVTTEPQTTGEGQ